MEPIGLYFETMKGRLMMSFRKSRLSFIVVIAAVMFLGACGWNEELGRAKGKEAPDGGAWSEALEVDEQQEGDEERSEAERSGTVVQLDK